MTATKLEIGAKAPAFSLQNQDGETVSLSDFDGKKVIVYFYPAAGTPGCTTQACDFRDNINSLASAGYQVLGVSKDSVADLKKFKEEQGLNFPLLSDLDLTVHNLYAAYGEKNLYGKVVTGVLRSTFVLNDDGTIQLALYNVKATGHVASLRKKLSIDADHG
jgi:peroxiredoxin Q/BCP